MGVILILTPTQPFFNYLKFEAHYFNYEKNILDNFKFLFFLFREQYVGFFGYLFLLLFFQNRISLCTPVSLETHSVDEAGLELTESSHTELSCLYLWCWD